MKDYVILTGIISGLRVIMVIEGIKLLGALTFSIGGLLLMVLGLYENRIYNSSKTKVQE